MTATNQITGRSFLAGTAKLRVASLAAASVGSLFGAETHGPAPGKSWQTGGSTLWLPCLLVELI